MQGRVLAKGGRSQESPESEMAAAGRERAVIERSFYRTTVVTKLPPPLPTAAHHPTSL